MSNYTPSEIALMIKEDRWKDVQEFEVRDFLKKVAPDEYVPNPKKFIQVKILINSQRFQEIKILCIMIMSILKKLNLRNQ